MVQKTKQAQPTHERIIKAFSTCISEKGIAAVTLRDLAKEANVSLGTIHYYFGSRENLIIELLNYELDFIENDIQSRFRSLESPEKKLRMILENGEEFITGDLWIAFIEIWTAALRNKKMKKSFASFYERLSGLISGVLKKGAEQGVFNTAHQDLMADLIIAMVEGIGLQTCIRGKAVGHAVFDFAVASFMKVLSKRP